MLKTKPNILKNFVYFFAKISATLKFRYATPQIREAMLYFIPTVSFPFAFNYLSFSIVTDENVVYQTSLPTGLSLHSPFNNQSLPKNFVEWSNRAPSGKTFDSRHEFPMKRFTRYQKWMTTSFEPRNCLWVVGKSDANGLRRPFCDLFLFLPIKKYTLSLSLSLSVCTEIGQRIKRYIA